MKKSLYFVFGGIVILLGYGCRSPELEKTPYGQEELRWEGFIKSNYTGWEAPQSVPPSAMNEPISSADLPALPQLPEINESPVQPSPVSEVKGEAESYTVSKGDTLWGISKKFYGEGSKWQLILDANKDKIPDPNKLKAGTTIKIPRKP